MGEVNSFPHWKHQNATPAEKLYELAEYATRHPEDVKHVILIWIDEKGERRWETDSDCNLANGIFLLEATKLELLFKPDANNSSG